MQNKDIPKKILKQIKYVRGDGYRILRKDGTFEAVTFQSKVGAAAALMGTRDLL